MSVTARDRRARPQPFPPRIFVIRYGVPRRRDARGRFITSTATSWIKVPYSGLFGLVETMARAISTGQVSRFCIDVAQPGEITETIRDGLVRWTDALHFSTDRTGVRWNE